MQDGESVSLRDDFESAGWLALNRHLDLLVVCPMVLPSDPALALDDPDLRRVVNHLPRLDVWAGFAKRIIKSAISLEFSLRPVVGQPNADQPLLEQRGSLFCWRNRRDPKAIHNDAATE